MAKFKDRFKAMCGWICMHDKSFYFYPLLLQLTKLGGKTLTVMSRITSVPQSDTTLTSHKNVLLLLNTSHATHTFKAVPNNELRCLLTNNALFTSDIYCL